MPQSILNAMQRWTKRGMYWPFVHDPQQGEPSVTLMFFYIGAVLSYGFVFASSLLQLMKGDYVMATVMPTMLFVLGFIFYRLRNLDKVKIDFDDKEIELSDESHKVEKEKENVSED